MSFLVSAFAVGVLNGIRWPGGSVPGIVFFGLSSFAVGGVCGYVFDTWRMRAGLLGCALLFVGSVVMSLLRLRIIYDDLDNWPIILFLHVGVSPLVFLPGLLASGLVKTALYDGD
jgi:hypothetical protein